MPVSRQWRHRASRKVRKGPSVAERQMILLQARRVVLPEGADPELGVLLDGAVAAAPSEARQGRPAAADNSAQPSEADASRPAIEGYNQ